MPWAGCFPKVGIPLARAAPCSLAAMYWLPILSAGLGDISFSHSHDQRYQLSRIQAGTLDYGYSHDAAGQVTGITGPASPVLEPGVEQLEVNPDSNQLTARGRRLQL